MRESRTCRNSRESLRLSTERRIYYGSIYNEVITFIYRFTDNANHVFIWKTAKDIPLNDDGIFNGTISGSIKEHKEYKSTKQTILTYVIHKSSSKITFSDGSSLWKTEKVNSYTFKTEKLTYYVCEIVTEWEGNTSHTFMCYAA